MRSLPEFVVSFKDESRTDWDEYVDKQATGKTWGSTPDGAAGSPSPVRVQGNDVLTLSEHFHRS